MSLLARIYQQMSRWNCIRNRVFELCFSHISEQERAWQNEMAGPRFSPRLEMTVTVGGDTIGLALGFIGPDFKFYDELLGVLECHSWEGQ